MLEIRNLSHFYDNQQEPVLSDVSFAVRAGELACLVGSSGCGKSTLLRLIAGLEQVRYGGEIRNNNTILANHAIHIPPEQRQVGLVFQHPSLFPHLNVEQNIRFGLRRLSKQAQQQRITELLELIGLTHKAGSYPHQLSGGQHQRVALARTLAPNPGVMLLDEPFANLDHYLRRDIREEVVGLLKSANVPIIMVTHDPEEALVMADSMILMNRSGTIHQQGTPDMIHNNPVDSEAAAFFSPINKLEGRIKGEFIHSKLGLLPRSVYGGQFSEGESVLVVTRPEGVRMTRPEEKGVMVTVESIAHTGAGWLVTARTPEGEKIRFHHIYGSRPQIGDAMPVTFEPPHIFVFKKQTA